MMKKLLALGLVFVGLFTMTACSQNTGPTPEELLTMISEAMDELALPEETSSDLVLPNTGLHDVTITWESSDPDIIANNGTVTQPWNTEGDQTVTITATLTLEDQSLIKRFDITVKAATELNDTEKVEADTAALFIEEGPIYGDLTLPTEGPNGTTITWESDKPAYLTKYGVVTRPEPGAGDEVVTLTATISLNGVERTKTFEFRVIEDVEVNTIADIKANVEVGTNVLIRALVLGLFQEGTYKGYFAYDGTGFIYMHIGTQMPTVEVGKVYQIAGEFDKYYGMPQIAYPTEETELDLTIEWPAPKEVTISDIIAYTNIVDPNLFSEYITITGNVTYDGTYYYLEDENGNKVELNNGSDISLLIEQLGKSVTINAFYHTYHGGHGNHQISFTGNPDDLVVNELSDADALAADVATINIPEVSIFDLTLPTEGINGTVFTNWTSSDTTTYLNDGTFVAQPADETIVTFTATATRGTETQTITVDVVVPKLYTIADALMLAQDDKLAIQGVVYSESYYGYHIFADGHYIFINETSYQDQLEIGDEVILAARVNGFYHDMMQLKTYGFKVLSQSNAVPTYKEVDLSEAILGLIPEGTPITVTGQIEVEVATYTNVYIKDALGNKIRIHYNSNDNDLEVYDGQVITIDVLVYTYDYLWYEGTEADATLSAFTDADVATAILYQTISELGNLNGIATDLTLPTSYADPAATIAWVSSDETVITNDGQITIAYGSQATAILTVTVTVGTEIKSANVQVTLVDGNDLTPMSVTEVIDSYVNTTIAEGDTVLITGVVTAFSPYGDPFIQDADGTAIVLEDFDAGETTVSIGDLIVAIGTFDEDTYYDDRYRLRNSILLSVTSNGNSVFIITDQLPADVASQNSELVTNKIYTMDLTVADNPVSGNASDNPVIDKYGYVFLEGDGSVFYTFKAADFAPYYPEIYTAGDVITVTFILSDVHYGNFRIYPIELPALTDAQNLIAAKAALDLPTTVTEDITLPTALPEYNATITWATSDATVISDTGVVTRPSNGSGDATVILTATIEVSGTTDTQTFTITVLEEAPAADVATVLTYAEDDLVYVTGVVKFILSDGTFLIEDADGTSIYVDDYYESIGGFGTLSVALGDQVEIRGWRGNYKVPLVDHVSEVTTISNNNALSTNVISITDIAALRSAPQDTDFGKTYQFTNVTVIDIDSTYIYFYTSDGTSTGVDKMGIYISESVDLSSLNLQVGDQISFTGIFFGANANSFKDSDTIWRFAIIDINDIANVSL